MKTRRKAYTMSGEESQGEYDRSNYEEEQHEEENRKEGQQEEEFRKEKSRSRRDPSPSTSQGASEPKHKSKRSKSSRKRRHTDEEESLPPSNENMSNLELLSNLTNYFEGRFKEIKQELIEENQAMCSKMNKRFKVSEHTFKRSGNKFQYHHNINVASKVEEAQSYLNRKNPNLKKAKETLDEGMEIIEERNKDILIADTSEGGMGYSKRIQEQTNCRRQ